jgi:hypothetical protein
MIDPAIAARNCCGLQARSTPSEKAFPLNGDMIEVAAMLTEAETRRRNRELFTVVSRV